jgi:hypothetical protein
MTKAYQLIDAPEKWTQGVVARQADGTPCRAHDPRAVAFCVSGAVQRVYYRPGEWIHGAFTTLLHAIGGGRPGDWNDDPQRTWQEAYELLKGEDL